MSGWALARVNKTFGYIRVTNGWDGPEIERYECRPEDLAHARFVLEAAGWTFLYQDWADEGTVLSRAQVTR